MNTYFSLETGGATEISSIHEQNQDTFKLDQTNAIFMIADGLGDVPSGKVASRVVVEAAYGALTRDHTLVDDRQPEQSLQQAFGTAHAALQSISSMIPAIEELNATLLIAWLPNRHNRIILAHVGGCRCYLVRQDKMTQLTHDHSVLNALRDANQLPEDPAQWPPHSLLSQVLGSSASPQPQVLSQAVRPEDFYFLCTDGIYDALMPPALEKILSMPVHPQTVCETAIRAAYEQDGDDDMTAIGIRIRISPYELAQDTLTASIAMPVGGN